MSQDWSRSVPSWRAHDARPFRPQLALIVFGVLGVLLLEVWQNSAVASLSMQAGKATQSLQQANAELEWTRASLARSSSRAELGPMAGAIGLKPVDPQHIVSLPEAYLEPAEPGSAVVTSSPALAFAGRALQLLVPEASARGRRVN